MKSLLHTVKTRRIVLLLCLFAILSLVFFIKLISYNSRQREVSELEVHQSYKVIQHLENIRYSLMETELATQSYLLTVAKSWKESLQVIHGRILRLLDETAELEMDPMQQKKFMLVKDAIKKKIVFQRYAVQADSITSELKGEMSFLGINRRLSARIQSPLDLMFERQQLLLQRRTDAGQRAQQQARLQIIFYAISIYVFILYALWQLRKQIQPGPSSQMKEKIDNTSIGLIPGKSISFRGHSGFLGVYYINKRWTASTASSEKAGVLRILRPAIRPLQAIEPKNITEPKFQSIDSAFMFSEKSVRSFGCQEHNRYVPRWKAAGLPEKLVMHASRQQVHVLGLAVNTPYIQSGPFHGHLPGNRISRLRLEVDSLGGKTAVDQPPARLAIFQLNELVKAVLAPFHSAAEEKGIRLLYHIDPAVPGRLTGDADQLSNILNCLFENAMRFTAKGYIQLTICSMQTNGQEMEIAFSVADTGRGIDIRDPEQVLGDENPGGQLPALATARQLVQSQNGHMMIHSTPEDGTVCCITLRYPLQSTNTNVNC